MAEESQRLTQQSADVDQTNDQKVDQANTQDASHHSEARQELAVQSHISQDHQHHVNVVVQNHLNPTVPTAGTVTGLVADAEGNGAPDCTAQLFFGPLVGIPVAVETTDSAGRFRMGDLPPGFYSLRVTGPDGATVEQWHLRVYAGAECRAQVRLEPAGVRRPVRTQRRGRAETSPEITR